jgi:hypothetical protein
MILVLCVSLLYLTSSIWLAEYWAVRDGGTAVYSVTLAAFGLLLWLVAVTHIGALSRVRSLST